MAALSTHSWKQARGRTGGFHHAGQVLSQLLESGFYETSLRGGYCQLWETRV